jgi:hypothetical protein
MSIINEHETSSLPGKPPHCTETRETEKQHGLSASDSGACQSKLSGSVPSIEDQYEKAKALSPCENDKCVKEYRRRLDIIASTTQYGKKDFTINHCGRGSCHTLFLPGFGMNCKKCRILWCDKCLNIFGEKTEKEHTVPGIFGEPDEIESYVECFLCDKCK